MRSIIRLLLARRLPIPALLIAAAALSVPTAKSADFGARQNQSRRPVPPPGWTLEETNAAWTLKPPDFGPSHMSIIAITKEQAAIGTLPKFFDGLWAGLGAPPALKRSGQIGRSTENGWETLNEGGVITRDQKSLFVVFMALQKGNRQFSMMVLSDSVEHLTSIANDADRTVRAMIGAVPASRETQNRSAPANNLSGPELKGDFKFKATFPAGWTRQDGPGFMSARHYSQYYRQVDHYLTLFPADPIQASLDRTFEAIWNREVARLGLRLDNPGLLSPERPQPLKRRLKNGLAVWFEGGVGRHQQMGLCYLHVFMIPTEKTVTTVAAVYVLGMEQTSTADRAPVWAFLESLQSAETIPQKPLFIAADCVGSWRMTLTAALAGFYSLSGAYLGDASTGGIDDVDLKPDGTYSRLFARKDAFTASAWQESGTWTIDDTILTLTPKSSKDQERARPQKHRVYGRSIFDEKVNLIVGAADDSRLPTDALESGAMVEVATRGGALLRFTAR